MPRSYFGWAISSPGARLGESTWDEIGEMKENLSFSCHIFSLVLHIDDKKSADRYKRDEKRSDDRYKKEERYKRDEETDERAVERSKDRRMRARPDRRPNRKNDRKVLMAEESTKIWADTDSDSSSSSSSSSSDSEQEEVHCLMADQASDDEVFDFSNIEFTREDLVQALNDMVHVYKNLSHTFEEIKAENASLKNSSAESSSDELEDTDSLKTELSKLRIENDLLRNESSELKAEVERLTKEMSSGTQSARAFHKLQESKNLSGDVTPFSDSRFGVSRMTCPVETVDSVRRRFERMPSLMPPRRRGRGRGQIPEEFEGQNDEMQRSIPSCRRANEVEKMEQSKPDEQYESVEEFETDEVMEQNINSVMEKMNQSKR
ncbi:ATP-dependent DNA helicase Q-like 4A [Dorcoceras hygrometricum]|uniref:ATP-dependent DNA helicase Q-like 4A n=1 Tax=Dorcoceras hygrometricum TaxID=472368 RepID=A0A2Z7AN63_9LAMI|nr:ATP-dependent DNA helicase Q-like 4A [Dorcoceras hygrometricum]